MGKTSKTPSFSAGTVFVNGQNKASTYKNGNNIISNYNMSDAEKRAYDYAQNSFADSLSKINVFDENTQKELQNQLDTYTLQGQKMINNLYDPMLNNLKTDIASRFGNFDNSIFMDNLNSIEANRADSINNLAQDVLVKKDELVNNELAQRYDYLSFLMDIQNQVNSNMFNLINTSQQNSGSGNSYNTSIANRASSGGLNNYMNLASNLLLKSNPYASTALSLFSSL